MCCVDMGKELDLQQACQNGDLHLVKKLLTKYNKKGHDSSKKKPSKPSKKYINVNYQDEHGRTCLHFAATVGDDGMLEELLRAGANPKIKEGRGQMALHYTAMHNKSPGVVETLLRHGAPPSSMDMHNNTPLHVAAMFGNFPAVQALVAHKVEVTLVNSQGYTPIDLAVKNGQTKVAALFLDTHSNDIITMATVNARHDKTHSTPLHLAARAGHADTCLVLLKHGMNVNRETSEGTALHEAVLHGRLEVTQLLCEHGADVMIKNVHGQTPLDVAQKFSAAHSADKLQCIVSKFASQEAMVGQAMEDFTSDQPQELSVRCGELVHILTKCDDGRWHCFVSQGQVQRSGYIPCEKLELLSAHCKPAVYMRASSQVLSERTISRSSSSHSLRSEVTSIPGNERTHSVSTLGTTLSSYSARLLKHPETVLSYEDARATMYDWLHSLGVSQYASPLHDAGYDLPCLLVGVSEVELESVGVGLPADRRVLLKAAQCLLEDTYKLKTEPDSVEDWLLSIGMGVYIPQFISNGFEELEIIQDLSPTILARIGISRPGHRRRLLFAMIGLKEWLLENSGPPGQLNSLFVEVQSYLKTDEVKNNKFSVAKPAKPARQLSKEPDQGLLSPPLSSRITEDPICNSFWETPPNSPQPINSPPISPPPAYAFTDPHPGEDEEFVKPLTVQPGEPIKKPKRTSQIPDGLSTLDRERVHTLERRSTLERQSNRSSMMSPPLSPGEATFEWDSQESLIGEGAVSGIRRQPQAMSDTCLTLENTPTEDRRVKRGSSEHVLDSVSPDLEQSNSVDLLSDQQTAPPSPNGYYETDIFIIKANEKRLLMSPPLKQPPKPMRRNLSLNMDLERQRSKEEDICGACKLIKEHPVDCVETDGILQSQGIVIEDQSLNPFSSDEESEEKEDMTRPIKDIDWSTMSPEVAAVVKSVYSDDTQDIPAIKKKVPPPVAPKPKIMKKAATVGALPTATIPAPMERSLSFTPPAKSLVFEESVKPVVDEPVKSVVVEAPVLVVEEHVMNGIEESEVASPQPEESLPLAVKDSTPEPQAQKVPEPVEKVSEPALPPTVTSVFDDLESMFDDFSKELDSYLT